MLPYVRIPLKVIYDKELTARDIAVMAAICSFINIKTRLCFPSIEKIAKCANLGYTTTCASIKRLEMRGHVVIERSHRKGNRNDANRYHIPELDYDHDNSGHSFFDDSKIESLDGSESDVEHIRTHINIKNNNIGLGSYINQKSQSIIITEKSLKYFDAYDMENINVIIAKQKENAAAIGISWDERKENVALKKLMQLLISDPAKLPLLVECYNDIINSSEESFWRQQPPTFSAMLPLVNRIEIKAQKMHVNKGSQNKNKQCPICKRILPDAAPICNNCQLPVDYFEDAEMIQMAKERLQEGIVYKKTYE